MGKDHTNYYHVKWSAYAELDDEEVDITGFEVTYALDEIPTIKIWPTVGRDPMNDKEAEAVKKFLDAPQYTSLKVYVRGETELDSPDGEENPGFPYATSDDEEGTLVFDGYLMGSGYVSTRSPAGGAVALVATGAHWLTGLAGTDAHTTGTTAKGPAGWDEVANPWLTESAHNFDIQSLISVPTNDENVYLDLWEGYIKEIFYRIHNSSRFLEVV